MPREGCQRAIRAGVQNCPLRRRAELLDNRVALGYGGNGITYAQIASDVIVGALTGQPDADADLYDFR
jgi:glycine/D-amino acid oxidase-like deaminating enzyme